MGNLSKQLAIYISLLLCCTPYTMIATFFPGIATSRGIPYWLIGAIFSADPASGLITSLLLGKYMIKLGRKNIILSSLGFSAMSMLVLAPIEVVSTGLMLGLSFSSRIFAGIAAGCVMTAGDSVFVSDYPDDVDTMVGRLEAAIGLGLIIGPLIGMIMFLGNLLIELLAFGVLLIMIIPVISKMLGEFRDYVVDNTEMNSLELLCKPKVTLDLGMNAALLVSFGFLIPTLELHLLDLGLSQWLMSLCFIFLTFSYSFFCFFGSKIFEKLDDRNTIFIGTMVIALGFLMLSPWQVIFPKTLSIILLSLPILGLGQAMIYLPTYPHMIKASHEIYGYSKDDILTDSLSGLSNMACNVGEIIGPLISGVLISIIGFEYTGTIIAFAFALYGIVYLFGSGLFKKWTSRRKAITPALSMKMVFPEDEEKVLS
ncbi:hypothetical protein SteCoe_24488 [Stentor coeruleus]|uniref:Major facilitator superfamily (MFS) profile domain-containing protein n=1 Tax=Stentor coeruleus TaxID=5963 RepID=A0A1R2BHD5_9CILI|nr:hypothetical protein SteCoe_24488 [Stentor coeruleus]